MKLALTSLVGALALAFSAQADDLTVKLSDVHLCCKKCVAVVEKAVGTVDGVKAVCSQDDKTISLTGADAATVQKAVDELVKAGFFGKSSETTVRVRARSGAARGGTQVQSLKVEQVHLCCDNCVKAVNAALKDVTGVKENTCKKGEKTFEVTGDFKDSEVFAALHKAGFSGKIVKE
jgi:copper chaperone CopZ